MLLTDQFYENIPDEVIHWIAFAKNLNPELTLSSMYKEAWNIARTMEDLPHLGNIFLEVLFKNFKKHFEIKYPKESINMLVNGLFSEVNINGFLLKDHDDFNIALLLYSNEGL